MHPDEVRPMIGETKKEAEGRSARKKRQYPKRSIIPFLVQLVNKPVFVFSARAAATAVRGQLVVALTAGKEAGAGRG